MSQIKDLKFNLSTLVVPAPCTLELAEHTNIMWLKQVGGMGRTSMLRLELSSKDQKNKEYNYTRHNHSPYTDYKQVSTKHHKSVKCAHKSTSL